MNKNNYYYRKLAQSIIFSENSWQEIVDPEDSFDNVCTTEFLLSLFRLLLFYHKKACLEKVDIERLQKLLSDIRFLYPYQSRTEKEEIYSLINTMIRMGNQIEDIGIGRFYLSEYRKRYGVYAKVPIAKELLACYYAYYLDDEPRGIKKDLSLDIYPLILLNHGVEELTTKYLEEFLLDDGYLSAVNALFAENKKLLFDSAIRKRFLYVLRQNKKLLTENREKISSGDKKDDEIFERHNAFVLQRLEKLERKQQIR